nr:hypothetical protein [Tanacetum cinerariifolium]
MLYLPGSKRLAMAALKREAWPPRYETDQGGNVDAMSVESGSVKRGGRRKKVCPGMIDGGSMISGCFGRVKDFVIECIGSEIKQRPKSEWITADASYNAVQTGNRRRRRVISDWIGGCHDETYVDNRKKMMSMSTSRGSRGSVDWWLDGFSGELWRVQHNSHDSMSSDIPKSGGISSTSTMRETVCYVVLEYSCGGDLSEKCDVNSFRVLLLVVIAGRRPLQVVGSLMSKFQRVNLLSWASHLARAWKLIDLADHSIRNKL